jgi:ABC-type histidine transport system ATPase subunit
VPKARNRRLRRSQRRNLPRPRHAIIEQARELGEFVRPGLLCDEITSALDPELVSEVLRVVEQLARDGMTLMLVTHEMRFAHDVGTKLVFMHHGKVHEEGRPKKLFTRPIRRRLRSSSVRSAKECGIVPDTIHDNP